MDSCKPTNLITSNQINYALFDVYYFQNQISEFIVIYNGRGWWTSSILEAVEPLITNEACTVEERHNAALGPHLGSIKTLFETRPELFI